ncbi:hypothetical protein [Allomuricauda sp. NBRC 101325]|uniref:hypothetical protein n=1 Tax=Allomuricauda sp. NBRC 101325 TaxID=1113758 RepID=UPI0024A089E6|nr:hypothetical protein [Muricauda sp. NBRC 101325]GLU43603.1 hypothetical protein Musp01_12270 [Muricauda sp. NBRC 101325]
MKNRLLILSLFIASFMFGQSYYKADILFANGSTQSGYAKLPNGNQKKVSFKSTEDDQPTNLKSDDLFQILFTLEDGHQYVLERNVIKMQLSRKNGELYTNITKKKGWLLLARGHKKMNYYTAGQRYRIDNDGNFKITSSGQVGFTGIGYYFRRPNEDVVTYITAQMSGIQVSHEKSFRNAASTYLSDNTSLAKRIDEGEFKSKQLDEVYELYISN